MKIIRINGGKLLEGEVWIQGSKNAALGVIMASLLTKETVVLQNVPQIQDVEDLLEILQELCVRVERCNGILIIDSSNLKYRKLDDEKIRFFRASSYFMGVMLARFGKCEMITPGGCKIGDRPLDLHFDCFSSLGVESRKDNELYILEKKKEHSFKYKFKKKSVGATINALLYASGLDEVLLENIAIEPEVKEVIKALRLMGVVIEEDNDTCLVKGRFHKNGFMLGIMPDRIECGTYAILGAAICKRIVIHQVCVEHIKYLLDVFDKINVNYEINKNTLIVKRSENIGSISISTNPYPSFPTDLQQPLCSLLCIAKGKSEIVENIYEERTAHTKELIKMGADITIEENKIIIDGVKELYGNCLDGKDLRGGASLIIAALMSKGESYITGLKYIQRGYCNIVENLKRLGADINVEEV